MGIYMRVLGTSYYIHLYPIYIIIYNYPMSIWYNSADVKLPRRARLFSELYLQRSMFGKFLPSLQGTSNHASAACHHKKTLSTERTACVQLFFPRGHAPCTSLHSPAEAAYIGCRSQARISQQS